jgi:1-acyl-sn-glycerol-3-phosphate acyltransferase
LKSWVRHPFRVTSRLVWLAAELSFSAASFAVQRPVANRSKRAAWLRKTARRLTRVFGIQSFITGTVPTEGMLICNHLSYLDIVVLASMAPCVFVAKRDVNGWPVFGWFARVAGTVFVNREQRAQVGEVAREITSALNEGNLVVLFPEGTSSGGESVLPFKSSLLEPAAREDRPLAVGFIRYELDDGDVSEEVCYWKDMTLAPHLLNLLSKRSVRIHLGFQAIQEKPADRKELARGLHREVVRLKEVIA